MDNSNFDGSSVQNIDKLNVPGEKEKNIDKSEKVYMPLERIERKLNAIIDWINHFVKENSFNAAQNGNWNIEGKFFALSTINLKDCERKNKDSE